MALSVVSLALKTIQDLLLEETKFLYGVSSQVRGLESQLREMLSLLQDAEKRQHESKSVRNWIVEMRDLSYKIEDVLETYAVQVSSRRGSGFRKQLKRYSCVFKEGVTLHQIGTEISDIRSDIERVRKSMQEYGIRNIIQGESSTSTNDNQLRKRQTYPFENVEDCFVGMEDDLSKLVSLIIDEKESRQRVISIWGMGGIGKTTNARKLYNHDEIRRYFQSFAWVCITQQCQIRSVLEEVLKQLIPYKKEEIMNLSDIDLFQKLHQVQKEKRCMIVLDDLWETDHWDSLKHAFNVAGINSKVLLTTRKENVAKLGFVYELGLLNVEAGWKLLKMKAFSHDNFRDEVNLLQEIGKEMVKKCGCLPLGICLLGGILKDKRSLKEWTLVRENMSRFLYKSGGVENNSNMGGVLNLSYEDLPYRLKPCFLYMGRLREDERIVADSLCEQWISEGMISDKDQQSGETLMDVAKLYLSEMVCRCMVQLVKEDPGFIGRKFCNLHDVMRELCLLKGKNEEFGVKVMHYQNGELINRWGPSAKTRYLTINFDDEAAVKLEEEFTSLNEENSTHIRSLHIEAHYSSDIKIEFPRNFLDFLILKLIRVLRIENCAFEGRKLPKEIGNLIHLRYFGLYRCELDELTSSISNWTYLYILDLSGSKNVRIPNVLKKMLRLKHLFFPPYDKEKFGNYRLSLEGLDELETLDCFDSLVHDLASLWKMKNLREFNAQVHDHETLSKIIDCINTNWSNLHKSFLYIHTDCDLKSTAEGLVVLRKIFTCSNIHHLIINVPIGNLAAECGTQAILPNLVTLILFNVEIEDDAMEILEKLPLLTHLNLSADSYVGQVMIFHAMGFPQLKLLQLSNLPNLIEWRVEQGAMPNIHQVEIDSCHGLQMIPNGFRFLKTLQILGIYAMPELGRRISESTPDAREGEDFHKVSHVPSVFSRL